MDVDPKQLRFLLAVARFGGVLAAADELGVTASAVSQQPARLERETGHTLLQRTQSGSSLTPAGQTLAEAAEDVERTLALARSRLAQDEPN
jgi:DNA-binding transcriptional LysR family regulator